MKHETMKAAAAFTAYCAQGPNRSLAQLAAQGISSHRYLKEWSRLFDWQERASAYDDAQAQVLEQRRLNREERREIQREAMRERHASAGAELFEKAQALILALAEMNEISADAAVRLLKEAAQMERQALGVAEVIENHVTGILSIEALRQIASEADQQQRQWEQEHGYGDEQ